MRPDPGSMVTAGRFRVPCDHPALAGHFPGRPVVPGVVVIDHAAWLVGQCLDRHTAGLKGIKFHAPVLQEQEIEVRYSAGRDGQAAFACLRGGEPVVTGVLVLR